MTSRSTFLVLLCVLLPGCADGRLCRGGGCPQVGNGIEVAERRELGEFSAVQSYGSIDVDVTIGSPPSAEVRGDENIVKLVRTSVKNGALVIATEHGYSTRLGLTVKVKVPRLDELALSGSGSICAQGVDTERLDVAIRGSGDIQLAGRAQRLDIDMKGSGNTDATALAASDVAVQITGSGDADVVAQNTLDVAITGSGDVNYAGDPKVHRSIKGSGDVAKR
jgi:hypothetical protein